MPLLPSTLCDRTKIQEGDKAIGEVLDWYEEVNSQTLAYVTYSIHDSDISDFYRRVVQTVDNTMLQDVVLL